VAAEGGAGQDAPDGGSPRGRSPARRLGPGRPARGAEGCRDPAIGGCSRRRRGGPGLAIENPSDPAESRRPSRCPLDHGGLGADMTVAARRVGAGWARRDDLQDVSSARLPRPTSSGCVRGAASSRWACQAKLAPVDSHRVVRVKIAERSGASGTAHCQGSRAASWRLLQHPEPREARHGHLLVASFRCRRRWSRWPCERPLVRVCVDHDVTPFTGLSGCSVLLALRHEDGVSAWVVVIQKR
jgi:hypothetical protein